MDTWDFLETIYKRIEYQEDFFLQETYYFTRQTFRFSSQMKNVIFKRDDLRGPTDPKVQRRKGNFIPLVKGSKDKHTNHP